MRARDESRNRKKVVQVCIEHDSFKRIAMFAVANGHMSPGKVIDELAKALPPVPVDYLELAKAS
jgi:hypothetical protein